MTETALPVNYEYNTQAWMTGTIFMNFLDEFSAKMSREKRMVCLLMDNAPVHKPDLSRLAHVECIMLPAISAGFRNVGALCECDCGGPGI